MTFKNKRLLPEITSEPRLAGIHRMDLQWGREQPALIISQDYVGINWIMGIQGCVGRKTDDHLRRL